MMALNFSGESSPCWRVFCGRRGSRSLHLPRSTTEDMFPGSLPPVHPEPSWATATRTTTTAAGPATTIRPSTTMIIHRLGQLWKRKWSSLGRNFASYQNILCGFWTVGLGSPLCLPLGLSLLDILPKVTFRGITEINDKSRFPPQK